MNISQVETILAIARTGSISEAANTLYKSQPNVSNELKKIENEYNVKLFNRSNNGVYLTPSGTNFLSSCIKIDEELDKINDLCNKNINLKFDLKIGAIDNIYSNIFLKKWALDNCLFEQSNKIYIHNNNSKNIVKLINNNLIDIGIISIEAKKVEKIKNLNVKNNIQLIPIIKYEKKLLTNIKSNILSKSLSNIDSLDDYVEIILKNVDSYGSTIISKNKIIVNNSFMIPILLNTIKNSFIWSSPIPKFLLKMNFLTYKNYYFETNSYIDFIIFKKDNIFIETILDSLISSFNIYSKKFL